MVYTIFFILLLIGYSANWSKNHFLFIYCLYLCLIIGLRHVDCFPDTPGYVMDFDNFKKMSFDTLLKECGESHEPLYTFFSWIPSIFSSNYPVFLLLWAVFPSAAIYKTFNAELTDVKDISIGFLIIFMIGLFAFFCTGIRQTAAMSILLYSYKYLKEIRLSIDVIKNKKMECVKLLLCIIIAFLFHNSSILFLGAIILRAIPFHPSYIMIAFGALALGRFVHLEQFSLLASMFLGDRFDHYGTTIESELSLSGYFVQLLIFLLCYWRRNDLINSNKENEYLLNMALVGLVFQSLTGVIGEMFRVAFFYNMFTIILVPRALKIYRQSGFGKIIEATFIVACLIYLFFLSSSNMPTYWSSIS